MPTLYEEVRALLRDTEFRPRKNRGQNFLIIALSQRLPHSICSQ
jgi:hypothetical protein